MLIKTVIVFLGLMVLVAMIGRALFPRSARRIMSARRPKAARCAHCGRYLIGTSGCDCKAKG
jgi:hypothetical protein